MISWAEFVTTLKAHPAQVEKVGAWKHIVGNLVGHARLEIRFPEHWDDDARRWVSVIEDFCAVARAGCGSVQSDLTIVYCCVDLRTPAEVLRGLEAIAAGITNVYLLHNTKPNTNWLSFDDMQLWNQG